MRNKSSLILAGLLLCSLLLRANETESFSDDTIPSRYRNYYYTEWYDECPAYQNGGWISEMFYERYVLYARSNEAKYEYTEHPIKIKGIAALVVDSFERPVLDTVWRPQYVYLLKRADSVDTVFTTGGLHHYRAVILDSARWDTMPYRTMEILQGRRTLDTFYCRVYEAYFDKPVTVDSVFYLYGSHNYDPYRYDESLHREVYPVKPARYYQIQPSIKRSDGETPGAGVSFSNACTSRGHNNTLIYCGYWDLSDLGYPVTGQPWLETTEHMPDDPYGLYLAIVENYKLDVYSDSLPMGDAEGSGIYYNSDGTEIRAIPHAGYVFSHWNDGNTDNPRIVYLTQDTSFTAYFDTGAYYNVQTAVTPAGWGTVEGGGTYAVNTEVELTAVPTEGFMFERWDDGDIQNPRTVTVTQDTLFTAVFALDTTPTGISEAGRLTFGIAPNPTGGRLTVTLNESTPCEAEVYDATGRCVLRATLQGPQSDLDVRRLPAGRYLLRLTSGDRTGTRAFVKN